MLRQLLILTRVQTCNFLGLNAVRHTRDRSRKIKFGFMSLAYMLVVAMIAVYVVFLSFALISMGCGDVIPAYLCVITSFIIFLFAAFKAGSVIFERGTFEAFSALPVKRSAIVISRFLTMYLSNLLLSALVMIPGLGVYAYMLEPGASFYVFGVIGTLLMPLLPLTVATLVGAVVTAIASRMRRKSIITTVLSILFVVAVLGLEFFISSKAGYFTEEMLKNLCVALNEQLSRLYPPAMWLYQSIIGGNGLYMLLFAAVSFGLFILLMALLTRSFGAICTALGSTHTKGGFRMRELKASSQRAALFRAEAKHYLSSSVWVTNTAIGYLLAIAASVALLVVGREKTAPFLAELGGLANGFLPLMMCIFVGMCPTTSAAISMEGKRWWLVKSLPVSAKDVLGVKLLFNLSLALPSWLISCVLLILALRPSVTTALWLLVTPLCFILYTTAAGLRINAAFPRFDWENEVQVVKQSASVGLSMIAGMLPAMAMMVVMALKPEWPMNVVMGVFTGAVAVLALLLYRSCERIVLNKLG